MQGFVYQVNAKPPDAEGIGLPKVSVGSARVTAQGVNGDFNHYRMRKRAGDPNRALLLVPLETEVNRLIKEGFDVQSQLVGKEKLPELCLHVPDYIPEEKPVRVVKVASDTWIACGGTHVKNIREIGKMTIRKIKVKGNTTVVSYGVG